MTSRPAFLAVLAIATAVGTLGAPQRSLAQVAVTVRPAATGQAPAPGTDYALHPGTRLGVSVENGSRLLVNYDGCWQSHVVVSETNPNVRAVALHYVWFDSRGRRIASLTPQPVTASAGGPQTISERGCTPAIARNYPLLSQTPVVPVVVVR